MICDRQYKRCLLLWLCGFASSAGITIAAAQIVADGSLGTRVSGPDTSIVVSNGLRHGQNLFHSFDSFSVRTGQKADFVGPAGVSRILARVTGPSRSEIHGTLSASSDLYFMNPNGVLFGEGANLDVDGLFVGTTANFIRLGDAGEFRASLKDADPSLLTVEAPVAYGFLGNRATAPIEIASTPNAQSSVTLVGGDIIVRREDGGKAGIEIESGDLTLLGSRGTIPSDPARIIYPDQAKAPLDGTSVNTGHVILEGGDPRNGAPKGRIATKGRVVIRSGEFQMRNFEISATSDSLGKHSESVDLDINGDVIMDTFSSIRSKSGGNTAPGNLAIHADGDVSLTVAEITLEDSAAISSIETDQTPTLSVTAEGSLVLIGQGRSQKSLIQATTIGNQPGSSVVIDAREDVRLEGRGTSIGVRSFDGSSETLGHVQVTAGQNLEISSRAQISSEVFGDRDGGAITVQTGGTIVLDHGSIHSASESQTSGKLGTVSVHTAKDLVLTNQGKIRAETHGRGAGGDIVVTAKELLIDGGGQTNEEGTEPLATGIISKTFAHKEGGKGGKLDVDVRGAAVLRNGGLIDSSTAGDGDGGSIFFRAGNLSIDGRDQNGNNFAFSTGITAFTENIAIPNAGRGGNIHVSLRQGGALEIFNGGQIDTSSFGGVGVAGNVKIDFDQRQGFVFIDKGGSERFTGIGSDTSGNGNAGSVEINTGELSVFDGGLISTGVFSSRNGQPSNGHGGDISVTANSILIQGSSPPDPSGQQGGSLIGNSAIYAGTRTGTAGQSGTITVTTTNGPIRLENGGVIGVDSRGSGEARSLTVDSHSDIRVSGNSSLTVASAEANAGDIRITANRDILVDESVISAQAGVQGDREATGSGGNIAINGRVLPLRNGSTITAQAVKGAGGNIDIETEYLLVNDIEKQINASSEFGVDGQVRIDSVFDLSESMPRLDEKLLSQSEEVEQLDPSKVPEDHSSFIPTGGRGGIPIDPGSYMPSLKLWDLPLGE